MIRKTALLTTVAAALVIGAPALAQEQTAPEQTPTEATATPAEPQRLTLTPGSTVKGSDGAALGQLVGVQNGASGQELTVRGADGQVRPVSVAGIHQEGADIVVAATSADFQSATPVAAEAPADPAADTTADPATDGNADTPADQPTSEPADEDPNA